MNDVSELIARLASAPGPALVLDAEIWCAANGYTFVKWDGAGCVYLETEHSGTDKPYRYHRHIGARDIRPFSASLDAAMILVPEGMHWIVGAGKTRPNRPLYGAQIRCPFPDSEDVAGEGDSDGSPALALCIAALKTRMAKQ